MNEITSLRRKKLDKAKQDFLRREDELEQLELSSYIVQNVVEDFVQMDVSIARNVTTGSKGSSSKVGKKESTLGGSHSITLARVG
jgi:hypothetical protein